VVISLAEIGLGNKPLQVLELGSPKDRAEGVFGLTKRVSEEEHRPSKSFDFTACKMASKGTNCDVCSRLAAAWAALCSNAEFNLIDEGRPIKSAPVDPKVVLVCRAPGGARSELDPFAESHRCEPPKALAARGFPPQPRCMGRGFQRGAKG
jgi:hypothetical protein